MLKVVDTSETLDAPATARPLVRHICANRNEDDMLESVMAGMQRAELLDGLISTYVQVDHFAHNLVRFFTDVYPATSDVHDCAVQEILDAACQAYLRREDEDGAENADHMVSHFLAAGLQAATYAFTHYNTTIIGPTRTRPWMPWTDGGLSQQEDAPVTASFSTALAPDAATRHAARQLLQRELLRWQDLICMHRVGIDIQSGELF